MTLKVIPRSEHSLSLWKQQKLYETCTRISESSKESPYILNQELSAKDENFALILFYKLAIFIVLEEKKIVVLDILNFYKELIIFCNFCSISRR